ncbi:MAG: putative aminoglycoside phosphotransferase [Gammaproteobacteria bacterium]|nr:putative aminoglycoside phosphotransferase [Gammaproteobacteria bacterium]
MGLELDGLTDFIKQGTESKRISLTYNRIDGGAIQQNYALDIEIHDGPWRGFREWVLRTDSPSGLQMSHSREKEFLLLTAAFEAGLTVPKPLWLCTDSTAIGRPFYVMAKVPGTADGRRLVQTNWTKAQRRAIVEVLGGELARLHAIDPENAGLSFLQSRRASSSIERIDRYRTYLDELSDPQPVLEWGLRWLELNAPSREETALCHGDFRTGNIMIAGDRVSGILDWEFAGYSNPVEDLGWYCARCWRFGADGFTAGGIGEKEDFVRAYEQASGRRVDRDELVYWQIMAEARWAVIALQQTDRHLSGRESSLELALTGYLVPEMELNLIHSIERSIHASAD